MISKGRVLLAALVVLGLSAAVVRAGDQSIPDAPPDPKVLLDTIRANRKALVAVNLGLTAEEGAKFWPLYERYQKEVAANGDRVAALIQEYTSGFGTMSDEKALQLLESYLGAEAERVKIRTTYVPEFAKVLPGRAVMRFYQIENKMDAVVRYDLAATIPVMEEGAAPAR